MIPEWFVFHVGMGNNILKHGMVFEWFNFNLGMRFEW
jgi:hypothetical protein